jgi:hypothetical protein
MHLSTLICSEQMTRSAALEEIGSAYPPEWVEPDTAFVAEEALASRAQSSLATMAAPHKRYCGLSELSEPLDFRATV